MATDQKNSSPEEDDPGSGPNIAETKPHRTASPPEGPQEKTQDRPEMAQGQTKEEEPPGCGVNSEKESAEQRRLPDFVDHPSAPLVWGCVKGMDREFRQLQLKDGPHKDRGDKEEEDRGGDELPGGLQPPRKRTGKTERHSSESPPPKGRPEKIAVESPGLRHRRVSPNWPSFAPVKGIAPDLERVPPEAKRVTLINGARAYSYIGSIGGVSSDALIVFTDAKGEAHHIEVRDQLWKAGEGYRQEVRRLDMTRTGVGMASGGRLPHYAVVHVRMDRYRGGPGMEEYLLVMIEALERGLWKAKEIG